MSKARMYGDVRKNKATPEQLRRAASKAQHKAYRYAEKHIPKSLRESYPAAAEDLRQHLEDNMLPPSPGWMDQINRNFKK